MSDFSKNKTLKEQVNGKEEIINGEKYWMGSKVSKCPLCGVAPTNVDDCGEFGNYYCPAFGVKGDQFEEHMKERGLK